MILLTTTFWVFVAAINADLEKSELLSELPMERLLQHRRSTLMATQYCDDSCRREEPVAQALVRPLDHMQVRGQPSERGEWVEEEDEYEEEIEWMPKGKGKGLGNIFDITVTALSFLAFAGYLLCLIVHAIKEKHEKTNEAAVQNATQQFVVPAQVVPLRQPIAYEFLRPGKKRRRRGAGAPGLNLKEQNSDEYLDSSWNRFNTSQTSYHLLLNKLIDTGFLFAESFVLLKTS